MAKLKTPWFFLGLVANVLSGCGARNPASSSISGSSGGALATDAGPPPVDAGSAVSLTDTAGTVPGSNPTTWLVGGKDVTCGAAPEANVTSIAVGPNGEIYLAGNYLGAADFGSGPLPVLSDWSLFLAKFDPGGTPVWAQSLSGSGPSVQVDHDGRAVMAVTSTTGANGGGTGTLRQFDPDTGAVRWQYDAPWTAKYIIGGVAVAAGTDSVLAIPGRLVKLDNVGHLVWSTTIATQTTAGQPGYPVSLVEAQSGNLTLYVVDYVESSGYKHYRLSAFDPAGAQRWTRRIDGQVFSQTQMVGNAAGTTAVFGLFESTVAIEGASTIGLGLTHFLGTVDASGTVIAQRDLGYVPSGAVWDKDNLVLATFGATTMTWGSWTASLTFSALTADATAVPMADPALLALDAPTVLLAPQGDSLLVAGSRGTAQCWDSCPCHQPRPYLMRIGPSGTRDQTFGEFMP